MKKSFLLLLCCYICSTTAYAQEGGETEIIDEYTEKLAKNTLFAEGGILGEQTDTSGNVYGLIYPLNFDRIIIAKPSYKIAVTAGLGVSSQVFDGDIDPIISIALNGLLGKSSHKLEVGLGVLTAIGDYFTPESQGYYTEDSTFIAQYKPARENTSLYLTARVGYRFQSETGGLFFRAGIMPSYALYTLAENTKPQLGGTIGIGYTFKNKTKTPKE